jgi:hypothetical protein
MNDNHPLTTTSISIPAPLLEEAKVRAALSFRTFSQYVSYLIHRDLTQNKQRSRKNSTKVASTDQIPC